MIETANHNRASAALLIYKTATRQFIARTLKSENGGAGDWFEDLVLAKLSKSQADRLRHLVDEAKQERAIKDRGGMEDEGPEAYLEESHFPDIVRHNWDSFRHSLKDRDSVVKRLRQIKSYRNEKVAHSSESLSQQEAIEIVRECQSMVMLFDSSASAQLDGLLNPAEAPSSSELEPTTSDEGKSVTGVSESAQSFNLEMSAEDFMRHVRQEQQSRLRRLDELIRQFEQVGEELYQVDQLKASLEARSIDTDLDDAWEELHSLRWLEIAPELVTAAFDQMHGGFGVEGTDDGWKLDFTAQGRSKEVYLQIIFSVD